MFQKQAKANKSKKDLSASCFIVEMNQNERHKFGLMKLCLSLCWESSYIAWVLGGASFLLKRGGQGAGSVQYLCSSPDCSPELWAS